MNSELHRSLQLTSMVCERGSALTQFKNIVFQAGQVCAFNGLVHLQAKSGLQHDETFAVSYDRLAPALRALHGEEFEASVNQTYLVLKKGKLTVRVRKLSVDGIYFSTVQAPPPEERFPADGFLQALGAISEFISADASRPWSVSALIRGGYAFATNNLSLVRFPLPDRGIVMKVPGQAVPLLLELEKVDWIARQPGLLFVGCGDSLLRFPESSGDWPNVESYFQAMPRDLPEADEELADAAKVTEKFSDRFVSLKDTSLEAKAATIESEYEVDLRKGKGTYNARLFSLVASHATHIDFSTYPKPVYFRARDMDGLMTGIAPESA